MTWSAWSIEAVRSRTEGPVDDERGTWGAMSIVGMIIVGDVEVEGI